MKVTVRNGQTLADIAIQVYGSAEAIFVLASDNNLDITDKLTAGMELDYSSANVLNKRIVDYYAANKIYPCTEDGADVSNRLFDDTFNIAFN